MKPLKEIMTPSPRSCKKNETLMEVSNQMLEHNIGALPVVDDENKVVGVVTDRDILLAICKKGKDCGELHVEEAMTAEVYTINFEEDAANALNMMREKKIGRLPIVDHEEKLVGIISFNSISRKMFKEDIEKAGKENVINTLNSIKDRNERIVNE